MNSRDEHIMQAMDDIRCCPMIDADEHKQAIYDSLNESQYGNYVLAGEGDEADAEAVLMQEASAIYRIAEQRLSEWAEADHFASADHKYNLMMGK